MKPPYYAVIFTSVKRENIEGYNEMAEKMEALAKEQEGFLGVESTQDEIGFSPEASGALGITVSYWKDLESIKKWKANTDHILAQQKGRKDWYKSYTTRIALVEREYSFENE